MLSGVYRFPPMESVIYGRPFAEAVKEQVEQSGATAVYLLASGTLARETDLVGQIRDVLGNRLAGVLPRSAPIRRASMWSRPRTRPAPRAPTCCSLWAAVR